MAEGEDPGAQPLHCFLIDDEPAEANPPRPGGGGGVFSVGQVGMGGAQPQVIGSNNPVTQQLVKNIVPPKFTGRAQDWANFVQDWERYLRKLSVCVPNLDNRVKLELWEGVLDESSLKFFRMRQKEVGEKMSYTEEFAKMDAKFSRDQSIEARRRWEEVVIFNPGKITSREWRDFEANFVSGWQEVQGASGEEARRLLLAKVPNFILKWITEEEERRSLAKPTIRMNVPGDIRLEEEVGLGVQLVLGKKPTSVSKAQGGDFEVVLPDFGDIERMLRINGKFFKGTSTIIKVTRVEEILDVEAIFLLVHQKMALRDRQDLLQSNMHYSQGRQKARAVTMDSDEMGEAKSPDKNKASSSKGKGSEYQSPKSPTPSTPVQPQVQSPLPKVQAPPAIPPPPMGGKGGWGDQPQSPWQGGKGWGNPWARKHQCMVEPPKFSMERWEGASSKCSKCSVE